MVIVVTIMILHSYTFISFCFVVCFVLSYLLENCCCFLELQNKKNKKKGGGEQESKKIGSLLKKLFLVNIN